MMWSKCTHVACTFKMKDHGLYFAFPLPPLDLSQQHVHVHVRIMFSVDGTRKSCFLVFTANEILSVV